MMGEVSNSQHSLGGHVALPCGGGCPGYYCSAEDLSLLGPQVESDNDDDYDDL